MAIVYISSDAAELNNLDGVTAGTVVALKAVVVDANKDVGTFRNVTISGTLSDGNYTFDTSGNVSGLGTVGSGAVTSSGVVTATGFTIGSAVITEAELEILDGATLSTTELNYVDGVTSAIQTQLGTKAFITHGTFTPNFTGGFSAVPSGLDMRYQIIGDGTHDYVHLTTATGAALLGNSNANTFTWDGIPAAAQPDTTVTSGVFAATNAGYAQMNAIAQITSGGAVTMAAMPLSSGTGGNPVGPWWQNTGWTASGTNSKGFAQGMVISYPLVIQS